MMRKMRIKEEGRKGSRRVGMKIRRRMTVKG
jgi:hypothetical protein